MSKSCRNCVYASGFEEPDADDPKGSTYCAMQENWSPGFKACKVYVKGRCPMLDATWSVDETGRTILEVHR